MQALIAIALMTLPGVPAVRAQPTHPAFGAEVVKEAALLGGRPDSGGWSRSEIGTRRGEEPSALARSSRGDVAIGDSGGVSLRLADLGPDDAQHELAEAHTSGELGVAGEQMRAVLPAVRDLAFDRRGELWIATEAGLYRWQGSGRPVRRALRGAEADPEVHDLAIAGDALLVATARGAYWSSVGEIFQPLEFEGVGAAVTRVALRAFDAGVASGSDSVAPGTLAEVWLLGANRLLRVTGWVTPVGLRVIEREPISLPRPTSENEVVDLAFDPSGDRLALVYRDLIAIRSLGGSSRTSPLESDWEIRRPVLAPGAAVQSLVWAEDGLALSTDHGVFVTATPSGPYLRSADPVGTDDCIEIALRPGRASLDSLMALCRAGLYEFEKHPRAVSGTRPAPPFGTPRVLPLEPDPPVEEIRRRALLRAGLDAGRSADLWSGLRRRALWPELLLRFGAEFDDDDGRDRDQSYVGGDTRQLFDHSKDRGRSFDASIVFDWDLGGVAYPLESVDLSRELRQVVSLRDDVADEINQLYFERQQLRVSIATAGALPPEEVARMRWRAREIDAGLDAWTGGWIARWRSDLEMRAAINESDGP